MRKATLADLPRFGKLKALPGPSQAHATKLLEKLAKLSQKVMVDYCISIPTLKEQEPFIDYKHGHNAFEVRDGVYYSQEIVIKLRNQWGQFYEWDYLVDIMAHELAHCRHANHSAEFYVEMDKIRVKLDAIDGTSSETFGGSPSTLGKGSIVDTIHPPSFIQTHLTSPYK